MAKDSIMNIVVPAPAGPKFGEGAKSGKSAERKDVRKIDKGNREAKREMKR